MNSHARTAQPSAGQTPGRRAPGPAGTAHEGTPMTTMTPPRTAERHACRVRVRLVTGPAVTAEARRRVRAAIASWPVPADLDAALLLTSELVTNAVRAHGGPGRHARHQLFPRPVRVDVHDTSSSLPAVADVPPTRRPAAACSWSRPCPTSGVSTTAPGGQGRASGALLAVAVALAMWGLAGLFAPTLLT
jgi:hypothetical protein